ncbi:autoinducer binding domain-containing protein [Bradyrhizobium sp. 172]|uniref:autoinducer binding domain-containing protein n=1 Tax=Bradyrhizobium sp. 172 TaxID=2782643 RepID=UPI001FFEFEE8|nr:autoinducer binding domain-containing protein [Bradyrhizobium sp. 172]
MVRRAMRQPKLFRSGPGFEVRNRPKPERALFEEADKFGIRCGFTFAILDDRCVIAALSFATERARRSSAFPSSKLRSAQKSGATTSIAASSKA